MEKGNLFSLTESTISSEAKVQRLGQHAGVIWLTVLPCSGKTTLALSLKILFTKGYHCQVLDGDNVRYGINSNLGFSNSDCLENVRRIT